MFTIEKGIPIPKPKTGGDHRDSKWKLLYDMEVGDSFLIREHDPDRRRSLQTTIAGYAKNKGIGIATRSVDDGLRVWKTTEPTKFKASLYKRG